MFNSFPNRRRFFTEKNLLLILLAVSVILNLFLAIEINNLKSTLGLVRSEIREHQIVLGRTVSSLNVKNSKGEDIVIRYNETPQETIVYVFSPDCIWCECNLQNIKEVFNKTQNNYKFIGLSLEKESSSKYIEEKELPFPVFHNPSDLNKSEYYFRATPSTYLVSSEGKIIKFWSGAFGGKTLEDVENFFMLKLPGLSE